MKHILDEYHDMNGNALLEGARYDEKAIKKLVDSGLFDEQTSARVVNSLYRDDIHAFVHSPAWLEKYLIGIVNMLIEYANGNKNRAAEFLAECPAVFDRYLTYAKEMRPKVDSDKDRLAFDNRFNREMSYEDVKKELEKLQANLDRKSQGELSKMKFSGPSDFELIPIESYDQFHDMFGGSSTGDGSSDEYAGGGGTSWCHANKKSIYDNWVNGDRNKFFVLANKNWKSIPFDEESNEQNPKDDYGNSLIVLLVDRRSNILKNATLRCNHVGVESNADNQYETYADLSMVAGFNVEDKINELNPEQKSIDFSSFDGSARSLDRILEAAEIGRAELTSITIPNSVTKIGDGAFYDCSSLYSVDLPDSVTAIGDCAFESCSSLESIEIPASVISIGYEAFIHCDSLTSIKIPDSVTTIGDYAFYDCSSMSSIEIPDSVIAIGDYTLAYCGLLSIKIPDSIIRIGKGAFYNCRFLKSIEIPDSVTEIGDKALHNCPPSLVIHTTNEYVIDYCENKHMRYSTSMNSLHEAKQKTSLKSNGVYSVMNDKWIKEPIAADIPEIDKEAFEKELKVWEGRYNDIINKSKKAIKEDYGEDFPQDFKDAFNLGTDDKLNALIDELGFDYDNFDESEQTDLFQVWAGIISKDEYLKHRQWDKEAEEMLTERQQIKESKEEDILKARSIIADQIRGEWDADRGYTKAAADLAELKDIDTKEAQDMMLDIASEEHVHVGELETAYNAFDPKLFDELDDGHNEANEKAEPADALGYDIAEEPVADGLCIEEGRRKGINNKTLKDVMVSVANIIAPEQILPDTTYDIHHLDYDNANNEIYNIAIMPARQHRSFHAKARHLGQREKDDLFKNTPEYFDKCIKIGELILDLIAQHGQNSELAESCLKTIKEALKNPDGQGDEAECAWCHDVFPKSELEFEKDFGPLCHRCIQAIKSHEGEDSLEFDELAEAAGSMKEKVLKTTRDFKKESGQIICNGGAQESEVIALLKPHYGSIESTKGKGGSVSIKYSKKPLHENGDGQCSLAKPWDKIELRPSLSIKETFAFINELEKGITWQNFYDIYMKYSKYRDSTEGGIFADEMLDWHRSCHHLAKAQKAVDDLDHEFMNDPKARKALDGEDVLLHNIFSPHGYIDPKTRHMTYHDELPTVSEALGCEGCGERIAEIDGFLEDVYDMRRRSIADEGEYSIGNLVFKELRNKGCLDELRDLKNELSTKELSLEEAMNGYLSGEEMHRYQSELSRVAHNQAVVQQNGLFHIYLVNESEAIGIARRISDLDFVERASASPSGKYDFSRINPLGGMPARYYEISGRIKV